MAGKNDLMDTLHEKYRKLLSNLKQYDRLAVAFSGGVDSSFLLKAAQQAVGENILAVTGRFISFSDSELRDSNELCKMLGIKQIIIDVDQMNIDGFCENTKDRCYFCKKALFSTFLKTANGSGFSYIAEGTNADDVDDYRPGLRAISELGIKSPLKEAGLTKEEIRTLSKELGLPTWEKASLACLATRFPYGSKITKEGLEAVDRAEGFLKELGFCQVRVRVHGNIARIEIDKKQFSRLLDSTVRESITSRFHELGFLYVTLDLDGYITGSMNKELFKQQ